MGQGTGARGFSLLELVVVIGVVLVLIGIVLPTLGAARERARATRTTIAVRSAGQAISSYSSDQEDVYPVATNRVGSSMLDWEVPLLATGHIDAYAQIDPEGQQERGHHRFAFSGALVHPAGFMEPGATKPLDLAVTVAVRQSQVSFPSEKGMLVQWIRARDGREVLWTWNPYERPLSPVAFCDGSVVERRCTDFVLSHDFFENWVGHPVLATWSGSAGRDRTR